jgi:ABC-type transporter Mla subunit MlaD
MTIDPFLGLLLALAGWVAVGLFGAWFAGLFEKPEPKAPPHIAAE